MNIILVYKTLAMLLGLAQVTLGQILFNPSVVFESLESKTKDQKVVFNEIKLKRSESKDIWTMKQSHFALASSLKHNKERWDHIKIVVHKDQAPHQVSYHQLINNKEVEYKASCVRCHSNGPRLIRPNKNSKNINLTFKDRVSIEYWNTIIKSYGPMKIKKNDPFKRNVHLIKNNDKAKKIIQLKSCIQCHGKNKARNSITHEQAQTINFLINNKQMPPWPHKLTKDDKSQLKKIIYGF